MANLEIGAIVIGLIGGLALFLYGMEKMTDSLKVIAGDRMKNLLARMTSNRFKGVLDGCCDHGHDPVLLGDHGLSSSAFISAGSAVVCQQSIGIIMGAEIGTTVTAQIIAFKVTQYSLILVAVGFFHGVRPKSAEGEELGHHGDGSGADLLRHGADERKRPARCAASSRSSRPCRTCATRW